MRFLLLFSLMLGANISSFGCFCASIDLCDLLDDTESDEKTIVFMGSFIQESAISMYNNAFQYRIEKIYRGEVVTPGSPYYDGKPYMNTDSTIWLHSAGSDACYRILNESKAIFIVTYNNLSPSHDSIGYVPTICRNDYYTISDGDIVTGAWPGNDFTMPLDELEEILVSGCDASSTTDKTNPNTINIYPNPVTDVINLEIEGFYNDLKVALYDTRGNKLKDIARNQIDVSELDSGVYFLVFTNRTMTQTKKFVKI